VCRTFEEDQPVETIGTDGPWFDSFTAGSFPISAGLGAVFTAAMTVEAALDSVETAGFTKVPTIR